MAHLLILGATGKTGRRTVASLTAAGHTVAAAARTPGAAAPGVTPVRFDWADPTTHDAALAGADGVYLIPPAMRLDHPPLVDAFARRAAAGGVQRLVLLSVRGADAAPDGPLFEAEQAVQGAGAPVWTVVRPTWFAQNFTESIFRPGIDDADEVVAPSGAGTVPFVDAQDIADVVAAALTEDGHHGRTYELSGPRALTFAQAAEILSQHAGRPLRHVDAAPRAWEERLGAAGVPTDYAALLGMLFGLIRDGHEAPVSDGVAQALGRQARSFEAWAAREAGALREPAARAA